jgi:iron only hydrogenase large subunit-like protein
MERRDAIYTERRECQDCHKCIRECPVKAIRVQDTVACVVPDLCIMCGNCVLACPQNAKQVRDDLPLAKELLRSGRRVIASLAPSFVNQLDAIKPAQLIHALKLLGFYAVSETALGAQQVSAGVRELMRNGPPRVLISSTCPVVVDYIGKYRPDCLHNLSPLLSPLLSHCKLLREHYGNDIGVVFIGPCIAKKKEAQQHPELLDVVLTYEDLDRWLAEEGIRPKTIATTSADCFEPTAAREGALYPIEGGMGRGVVAGAQIDSAEFMAFSGIPNIEQALNGISDWKVGHNVFLEMTACAGSCVNGPKARRKGSVARRRYDIVNYARPDEKPQEGNLHITEYYVPRPVELDEYTDMQLREALRTVGKYSTEDELNCGGCGYDSCRDFARALIAGNAERMMCATYTRKLAQQKANALLQRMPSAVVIVNDELKIIECNANFMRLFADHAAEPASFEGSALSGIVPCSNLFRRVLESGEDIVGHDIRYERAILNTSIFTIEPHSVVGGIFQDITEPAFQKEQIIERARAVIQKNLKTVQQIAYLLGENAADSEIILNSIVRSFSPEEVDDGSGEKQP